MSIAFPNEPSGTTPLMDWGHNALTGGGWYDIYNGYMTSIISDGTAPLSPSNVLQQRFPQGLVGGYGGGGGNTCPFPTFYPQGLFYGFWMKIDTNYEHHPVLTKIAWIHTRNGNTPQTNNLFMGMAGAGSGLARLSIHWQWADGQPDNSHLGFVGSGYRDSSLTFSHNTWVKVEWLFRASTSLTSRNGLYQLWMNNTLACNVTDLNTPPLSPDAVSHITIWGGTGTVKSRDSYIWFDHEYAAALSGGAPPPVLVPTISSITPTSGPVGTPVTIVGSNFAGSVAGNVITLNGVACQTLAASTTQLNTAVPNTGTTGQFTVTTAVGAATSATSFTVTVPDTGGGSGGGTGGGAGTTTYTYSSQYSGTTQGPVWYYLRGDGTPLNAVSGVWRGDFDLSVWDTAAHPGTTDSVIVKWVAPGYGSARITGSAFDTDLGNTPTGNNAIFTILKNGTDQLYQYTVVNLDSTGQAYDVTTTIAAGDYIYFKVTPVVYNNWASISMNPVIIYSPQPQEEEEITLSLARLSAPEFTTSSVTLSIRPTRATDSIISLVSDLPTTASVPETVTIPANSTSVEVPVELGIAGSAIVTATLGTSSTTTLVVSIPTPDVPVVSPTLSAYTDFLLTYRWF